MRGVPIVANPTGSHGGNPRQARIGCGPCPPAFGRIGKALVALALTVVAVLGTATPALAHNVLISSDPANGASVAAGHRHAGDRRRGAVAGRLVAGVGAVILDRRADLGLDRRRRRAAGDRADRRPASGRAAQSREHSGEEAVTQMTQAETTVKPR